jgi:hypothetical protein
MYVTTEEAHSLWKTSVTDLRVGGKQCLKSVKDKKTTLLWHKLQAKVTWSYRHITQDHVYY